MINEQGGVVSKGSEGIQVEDVSYGKISSIGILFLTYNIPPLVFSVMCIIEHKKDHKKQQLNKMNIQDL